MAYYEFPHTENYDEDLGWLIEKYGDIIEAIEDHETRIKYLEEHGGGGGGGKDYSKEIAELQTGLANLKTTVTSNKTATDKEIRALNSAITALQNRAATLESRMTAVEGRITTAEGNITTVKNTAETASKTATTANTTATEAKTTAESAKTTAEAIATTATEAKKTAESANATATEAKTTAEAIKTTADEAKTTAETANATAETAKTTAETAQATADANTETIKKLSFVGKETAATLTDLPRPGEENKIYYVTDIKGYYIYNGEAYRSIDATAALTLLDAKQDTLVSGTNIKTVNGNSLLGTGNIEISGGGGTVINYGPTLPDAGEDYANQLFIVQQGFPDKVTLYKCIVYNQGGKNYYKWALVTSTSIDGLTFSSLTAQNSDQKVEGAGTVIATDYTSGISGINFRNSGDSHEPKLTTQAWLDDTTQDAPLVKMYSNSELPTDTDQIKESLDPYTNTIYFNTTTGHYYLFDKTNEIWYRIDAIKDGLMDVTGTTDEYIYIGSNKRRVTIRDTNSWTTVSANAFNASEVNSVTGKFTGGLQSSTSVIAKSFSGQTIRSLTSIPTSPQIYQLYNFGDGKLWYNTGTEWRYFETTTGTPEVTATADFQENETAINECIALLSDDHETGVKTDDPLLN